VQEVRRYRVRGRVQGVAFRAFVLRTAASLGLDGWVRNRADGSVEVLAHGKVDDLDELSRRLLRGSRWSRVDDVNVLVEEDELGGLNGGFSIRPTA